jgi:hypothetical protein
MTVFGICIDNASFAQNIPLPDIIMTAAERSDNRQVRAIVKIGEKNAVSPANESFL